MASVPTLILVWLALLVLLAANVAASFLLTGAAGYITGLGIAFIQAGLIFWFYMHLREESGLNRLAAVGAVAWLFIMALLFAADYALRG